MPVGTSGKKKKKASKITLVFTASQQAFDEYSKTVAETEKGSKKKKTTVMYIHTENLFRGYVPSECKTVFIHPVPLWVYSEKFQARLTSFQIKGQQHA